MPRSNLELRFLRWSKVVSPYGRKAEDELLSVLSELVEGESHQAKRVGQDLDAHLDLDEVSRRHPFNFQTELIAGIHGLFNDASGQAGLLSLPTGGGKTATTVRALIELFNTGEVSRCIWAAPARELLDQAGRTFADHWPDRGSARGVVISSCHHGADLRWTANRQILLVTLQMLARRTRNMRATDALASDCIVVDEAHHAGAPGYYQALKHLQGNTRVLIGLSATPGRHAESGTWELLRIFDERLIVAPSLGSNPVRALQLRGVLSELEFHLVPVASSITGLIKRSRSKSGPAASELASHPKRFEAAVLAVDKACADGRALVFASDLNHAAALTAALRARGGRVGALSGVLAKDRRAGLLEKFKTGAIQALVNVRVLSAGYDLPSLGSVVLTSPVESPILFEQIVGRVTRGPLVGGTKIGRVWQLDDHLQIHGLPQSYHRFEDYGWSRESLD